MQREEYVQLLTDLFNRAEKAKERERRVREANRKLYSAAVGKRGSRAVVQADLALAAAAQRVIQEINGERRNGTGAGARRG